MLSSQAAAPARCAPHPASCSPPLGSDPGSLSPTPGPIPPGLRHCRNPIEALGSTEGAAQLDRHAGVHVSQQLLKSIPLPAGLSSHTLMRVVWVIAGG